MYMYVLHLPHKIIMDEMMFGKGEGRPTGKKKTCYVYVFHVPFVWIVFREIRLQRSTNEEFQQYHSIRKARS